MMLSRQELIEALVGERLGLYLESATFRQGIDMLADFASILAERLAADAEVHEQAMQQALESTLQATFPGVRMNAPNFLAWADSLPADDDRIDADIREAIAETRGMPDVDRIQRIFGAGQ